MQVTTLFDGEDYCVWAHLDDEQPPSDNSFVCGVGKTSDQAKANAVAELEACIKSLQAEVP